MIDYPVRIGDHVLNLKLREIIDELNLDATKLQIIASSPSPLTLSQIQQALSLGGSNPLNITGLQGFLASPQSTAAVGAFANRPAAGGVAAGGLYFASDQATLYISDGTNWSTVTKRILFSTNYAIFAATLTADRTYSLPDATGNLVYETAALTLNNFVFGGGGALAKDAGFAIVPVANGGTAAATAAGARTSLGAAAAGTPGAHTITLAKITGGGANGSITWNADGVVTSYVDPT